MKKSSVMAVCLFLVINLFVLSQCFGFRHLNEGERIPDFSLKDLTGKTHSISQLKGNVVLVLYWRLGQERSLKSLEALKTIAEDLSDQSFQILAITKDTDKLSEIKSLKKSAGIPFPVLLDSEEKVYSEFGVFVFPSTALIDSKGVYRYHYGGFRGHYKDEIFGRVRVLLGLITEKELAAENGKESNGPTEDQKKAINHISFGKKLRDKGMGEKAMQEFKKAVELDPDNPEGHIFLGFSLLDKNEIDQALVQLKLGAEQAPRSAEARIGLGRAYRLKGQKDKALEILKNGLNLCPDSALIHFELGAVYEALGKTDDALKHYKASTECYLKKSN